MALRIRTNGQIVCAAFSEPNEGDIYIDDRIHYWLAKNVLEPIGDGQEWVIKTIKVAEDNATR